MQYRQKKMDVARETLEKALSDAKVRNPEARFLLGKIYRDDKKDLPKAVELLKKAGEEYYADPPMASVSYDELAQTYELKKEVDNADATYAKALNADKASRTPCARSTRPGPSRPCTGGWT